MPELFHETGKMGYLRIKNNNNTEYTGTERSFWEKLACVGMPDHRLLGSSGKVAMFRRPSRDTNLS